MARPKGGLGKNNQNPEDSFWSKVAMIPEHSCWEWIGAKVSSGYGSFGVNRRATAAHRYSYELHYGPITKGLCVLHRCDNSGCVRPEHLVLGTKKDNAQDMARKGRGAFQPRTHCKNGHEFSGHNKGFVKSASGNIVRRCRKCNVERQRKIRSARKENNEPRSSN